MVTELVHINKIKPNASNPRVIKTLKFRKLVKSIKQAFVIKDNLSFGEWDYDLLSNEWDSVELDDWGLDVWQNEDDINNAIETEEPKPNSDRVVCALCGK